MFLPSCWQGAKPCGERRRGRRDSARAFRNGTYSHENGHKRDSTGRWRRWRSSLPLSSGNSVQPRSGGPPLLERRQISPAGTTD